MAQWTALKEDIWPFVQGISSGSRGVHESPASSQRLTL